jgi:hypothetical protein
MGSRNQLVTTADAAEAAQLIVVVRTPHGWGSCLISTASATEGLFKLLNQHHRRKAGALVDLTDSERCGERGQYRINHASVEVLLDCVF